MKKTLFYSFSLALLLTPALSVAQGRPSPQSRNSEEIRLQREAARKAAEKAAKKLQRDSIPLFGGVTLGLDLIGPGSYLMSRDKLEGQLSAEVNFKNRYYPVIEIGTGRVDVNPDAGYNFRSRSAFYTRVGMNYAFQSNPNFYFYGGVRYGLSHVGYDILGLPVEGNYWGESATVDIRDQRATSHWASLVGGIKVKIYRGFSMGWNVRYNFLLSTSKNAESETWYIPGYGMNEAASSSRIGVEYNLYYQLPFLGKKRK